MKEAIADVRARIAAAARGRQVTLIAVTKTQPVEVVREAMAHGLTVFGENYAQELRDKASVLPNARWHFIGRFQKNKINMLKDVVECWQTLSSLDDARALAARVPARMMLQVNIGREPQKAGADPDAVVTLVQQIVTLPLVFEGLMCIPPVEASTASFVAMAELGKRVADLTGRACALSMGMSDDFEEAIRHGATHVRVGTRLFGARPTPRQSP